MHAGRFLVDWAKPNWKSDRELSTCHSPWACWPPCRPRRRGGRAWRWPRSGGPWGRGPAWGRSRAACRRCRRTCRRTWGGTPGPNFTKLTLRHWCNFLLVKSAFLHFYIFYIFTFLHFYIFTFLQCYISTIQYKFLNYNVCFVNFAPGGRRRRSGHTGDSSQPRPRPGKRKNKNSFQTCRWKKRKMKLWWFWILETGEVIYFIVPIVLGMERHTALFVRYFFVYSW